IYNFGVTSASTDRAIGFLSSGTATQSGNLYGFYANNTGGNLTGLKISYNVEKYRHGSNPAGFGIQLYYSTDGSTWTSAGPSFSTTFLPDADNTGFTPAPGVTVGITNQILSVTIPNAGNLYLAWNYSVSYGSTTTNGQALAIDDISVLAMTDPTGSGVATPNPVQPGNSTLLTVAVKPGASTGIGVAADLSLIGGSATQQFYDDGSNGDAVAGDNIFSFQAAIPANATTGIKLLPATVSDAQSHTSTALIALNVNTLPSGAGSANPTPVPAGGTTLLTVAATAGASPPSASLAVTGNLTSIGGSASTAFFDDGTHGDVTAGDKTFSFLATVAANSTGGDKTLPITISDLQSRSGSASIALTVTVTPSNPTATGTASPTTVQAGNSDLLVVTVIPGANPTSTGLAVTVDLSSIGGSASQQFFDDGTHGDATAGDNKFSFLANVPANTTTGAKSLSVSVTDAQTRSATASIALTVSTSPTGVGSANPNSLLPNAATLLTVAVTPGSSPPSTGITVTADLSSIGGSSPQTFYDDGTHGDVTAGDNLFSFQATVANATTPGPKTLTATVADAQLRSSTAPIALTVLTPPAPTSIKISQVYGGGGNSGTTYKNDFIELFNQSNSPVDITSWSVQQASATFTGAWSVTPLCPVGTCIVQPYHYFLVWEGPGAGGTTSLPTADVTGTLSMGATSGKVALVNNTTAISGNCPSSTNIADLVGYGSTCFEIPLGAGGASVPSLDNLTAAVRKGNGCVDTDNNSTDFVTIGPIPRNSSAPANVCGGDPTKPSGVGTASPSTLQATAITLLTVTVAPATAPPSTGITVTGDLTSLGGSASQLFYDDGTHGDVLAGDNIFSVSASAPVTTGAEFIPVTITDAQSRTAPAPITITVSSPTCGVERWSVKVGTDPDAGLVNLINPVRTTISALRAIPAPADPPGPPLNARVQPTEITAFVVNGIISLYKLETDVDYHIVLKDLAGNTIVTEIPSPACDGSTSPFDAAVAAVRAKFDARFTATDTFQTANVPVQMRGVGFFDFIHGQTGVAPNGIELHPILDIAFTTASTTLLTATPNPALAGQSVTFTATVTSAGGTATGSVNFYDGANLFGVGTLGVGGQATLTTSALAIGPHSITASYEGDSLIAQSISSALTQNVQGTPVLTWANPADITFGASLGSAQLNATADVPGSFVYTPAPGTVLPVGNQQTLSVAFTPTSTSYNSASKSVAINVVPVTSGGSPANVVVTRTLARAGGQVVATLTISNNGGTTAQNVILTTAKIGTVSTVTPLPQSLGDIPAGGSVQTTVAFPGTVGPSGAASSLSVSGTYTTGSFSNTARITLP
ncbi:MAG TPA: choice-of-anchor X domain-containing protein, partial [Candidatus Solibacter sp.]